MTSLVKTTERNWRARPVAKSTALAEDQVWFPAPTRKLTTTCPSSSRSDVLVWTLRHPYAHAHTNTHTHTIINIKIHFVKKKDFSLILTKIKNSIFF